MRSHIWEFEPRALWSLFGPTIGLVFVFGAAIHGAAKLNLLPRPRPALDTDRTILCHQVDAARSSEAAAVVLIGDSSCLMDVSARELGERLGMSVLNLATFSYLGLPDYAKLIGARAAIHGPAPKAVVLLMHPEALRRASPDPLWGRLMSDYFSGKDRCEMSKVYDGIACVLGLEIVRGRIVGHVLPQPLRGAYAETYGFTSGLDRYMTEEHGSLIDVEPKRFSGNAEYRLSESIQGQSRAFRSAVPNGTKLLVGITPVPESFAPAGYVGEYQQMLQQWSQWLGAEALTNLPPMLPDRLFSKVTHLNREGVPIYTEELARSLASLKRN